MKRTLLVITGFLLSLTAYCQKINYESSLEAAIKKAAVEKKMVLLIIQIPTDHIAPPPGVTNFKYRTALDDSKVVDLFNKNFVSYAVSFNTTEGQELRTKYKMNSFPAYIFLDGYGAQIYKETGNSISPEKYIAMSQKAIEAVSSGKTVGAYQAQYLLGNRSADFLKEYITLKESQSLYDNAVLIDDYVEQLTIKSFHDYQEVLFILQAGPLAYGKAYGLCFTDRKIVDSIFKYEPAAVRSAINSRIINNTLAEAIKRKDITLAQHASSYTSGSWRNNPRQGMIASQSNMLHYYSGINDTTSYYRQATYFYDSFYMNISADSAKKKETMNLAAMKRTIQAQHPSDTVTKITYGPDSVKRVTRTISHVGEPVTKGPTNPIALTLNNAAYQFYTLGTHNQTYLTKAMLWSKRSIELDPRSGYFDTLAHLLYRLGFYEEATSAQTKAVNWAEAEHADKDEMEKLKIELTKIKTHKLNS